MRVFSVVLQHRGWRLEHRMWTRRCLGIRRKDEVVALCLREGGDVWNCTRLASWKTSAAGTFLPNIGMRWFVSKNSIPRECLVARGGDCLANDGSYN